MNEMKTIPKKELQEVLMFFKKEVAILYGSQLENVLLYGSQARGDATTESDIDVLVVLKKEVDSFTEIDNMIDIVTDIVIDYGEFVSIVPISSTDYKELNTPFLRNVVKDTVVI